MDVVIQSNVREIMEKIDSTAKARMLEAVHVVRNRTVENLSHEHLYGRVYNVPGFKRKYTASSPGEYPATATGTLKKTIRWKVENEGTELVGKVGSEQEYAPALEYGTSKMKPRTFLRPSFEQCRDKIREIFTREWLK